MPHTRKRKKYQTKKIEKKETKEVLTSSNARTIADCFVLAIEERYMTYRDFKRIQEILDKKYWKPDWVPEKTIK